MGRLGGSGGSWGRLGTEKLKEGVLKVSELGGWLGLAIGEWLAHEVLQRWCTRMA